MCGWLLAALISVIQEVSPAVIGGLFEIEYRRECNSEWTPGPSGLTERQR